jgi:hypothetical protein
MDPTSGAIKAPNTRAQMQLKHHQVSTVVHQTYTSMLMLDQPGTTQENETGH